MGIFYDNYGKKYSLPVYRRSYLFFLRHRSTASKTAITAIAVRTMTHPAAPPAVVMAIATAVVPLRRRSRAQMKVLDLPYQYAVGDWCRGTIKAFRLATLSATTRIH